MVLVKVTSLQSSRVLLAVSLRKAEDNAGIKFLIYDQSHNFLDLLTLCHLLLLLLSLVFQDFVQVQIILELSDGLREIVLLEGPLLINDQIETVPTSWVYVMLERCRSVVSVHYIARLLFDLDNPFCELSCVRYCGREESIFHDLG